MNFRKLLTVFALCTLNSSTVAQIPSAGLQMKVTDTQSASPFLGQFEQLTDATLTVTSAGGTQEIPVGNLRRVEFVPAVPLETSSYFITLRDGSTCTAKLLKCDGRQTSFTLAGGLELTAATQLVADIRLRELTEAQAIQWQAIRDSRLTADLLVLVRSEESLDKIEGVINRITSETVDFDFSGQMIPAPLTKLAGIRFYSKLATTSKKLAAVVRDTSGNQWNAAQLSSRAGSDTLEIVLQGGLSIALPRAQLAEIDFGVGSMKYLTELEPVARTSTPRFELAVPISGSDQLFGARLATSAVRGGPSIEFLGSGSVTYRTPADFTRLIGAVELNPPGNKVTPCTIKVLIEKKVVWEQRIVQPKQSYPVDIPVAADQRVELLVQADSGMPVGDTVLFRELRFLK